MPGKEDHKFAKTYQSDQEETEDEEVKRNCIMGESGMRDSDFFDSDSEMEEDDNEGQIGVERKEALGGESEEDRMVDLVKFVCVGSQILMPKGVSLCRPMPIVPSLILPTKKPDENEKTLNESNMKSSLPTSQIDTRCRFSSRSKLENESEISESSSSSSSNRDSDSHSNDGDVESVGSDTDMKSTSLDFSFDGGEELSIEDRKGITNIVPIIEESCCMSSFDDQQEAQESINGDYALVGASGASVDDVWLVANQKRVLSSNTLSALNQEAGLNADHAKKIRLSQQSFKDVCAIPDITIGIEALDQIIQPLPRQYRARADSLLLPSSSDDEEDKMLSEELEEKFRNNCVSCSGANFPIPLLTPPQSPRTVDDIIEGQVTTSIEWPSNLVMDSAVIMAFANISTVSTTSERDEQLKNSDSSSILGVGEPTNRSLAPRIRTISVGTP